MRARIKGTIGSPLIMVGLMIGAVMMAGLSIPVSQFFSDTSDRAVNDLNRMVETRAQADLYFYNYVPTAAAYSTYQTAHDLGDQGGGTDIDWNSYMFNEMTSGGPAVPPIAPIGPGSCSGQLSEIECNLEQDTSDYLDVNYLQGGGLSSTYCSRPDYAVDIFFLDDRSTTGYLSAFQPIESTCNFYEGQVHYEAEDSFLFLTYDMQDNRFLTAANSTNRTLFRLYHKWQNVGTYTASNQVCGSPTNSEYQTVLQDATDDAEDDITSYLGDVQSAFPKVDGFTHPEFKITGPSDNLGYGVSTDKFKDARQPEAKTWETSNGNCCFYGACEVTDQYGNCITNYCERDYHTAHAEVKPNKTNVKLVIRDMNYKIPTENGWKRMNFVVNPYTHVFTSD